MKKKYNRFSVQYQDHDGYYGKGYVIWNRGYIPDYWLWAPYTRERDAVRGFTRFVNRQKLKNVKLVLTDGTEIIYE